MGIGSKYSRLDCGCGQRTPGSRTYGTTGCCNKFVQPAPEPCCEAHDTMYKTGICFYPAHDTAVVSTGFWLFFSNDCDLNFPLNARDVFFYHAGAGHLRITGKSNGAYLVTPVDETKDGVIIQKDDCVLVSVNPAVGSTSLTTRCLAGQFVAPADQATGTIYILNGSGIPIGSTLTFTAGGETGSYVVTGYISASGSIYAYTVQNTGSGHTAGLIIDSGVVGGCEVPIEIITEVDLCGLSSSLVLDSINGCVNGTPRSGVSAGLNSVFTGDGEGGWDQKVLSNLDCCVTLAGTLKFSGDTCPSSEDQVVLEDVGLDCFEDAFNAANNAGQGLPMNIAGFNMVATAYDAGTRRITLVPQPDEDLDLWEFPAGSQLCLGGCCKSCLNGAQMTDHRSISPFATAANYALNNLTFDVTTGTTYWLLGFNLADAQEAFSLGAPYFADPDDDGPKLPHITDPLLIRQKICNTSEKGCHQIALLEFNFQAIFAPLVDGEYIDWEIGHYAGPSTTLNDGSTPNPFTNISTQAKASGRIHGPTTNDTAAIGTSAFGFSNAGAAKVFPVASGFVLDEVNIDKCSCAQSILWLFVRVQSASDKQLSAGLALRRWMRKLDRNIIVNPNNTGTGAGFAN